MQILVNFFDCHFHLNYSFINMIQYAQHMRNLNISWYRLFFLISITNNKLFSCFRSHKCAIIWFDSIENDYSIQQIASIKSIHHGEITFSKKLFLSNTHFNTKPTDTILYMKQNRNNLEITYQNMVNDLYDFPFQQSEKEAYSFCINGP